MIALVPRCLRTRYSHGMTERSGRVITPVITATAASVVFGLLLLAVIARWAPLFTLDDLVARTAHDIGDAHPSFVVFWRAVSLACEPLVFRIVAIVALVIVWVPVRRHGRGRARDVRMPVTIAAATVLVGGILPVLVKAIVGRPRPVEALIAAAQTSFPSAHAFGITTAALCGVLLLRVLDASQVARRWAALAAGALIALVCVARVALAVHYVSDVAAGVALAVAWVAGVDAVTRRWIAPAPRRG
ncbi:hypothetical protein GCM10010462_07690 [Microbacterium dextranolyticum]